MKKLLAGEDTILALLRKQLEKVSVSSRKITGVGFYAEFYLPEDISNLPDGPSFKLGDVNGLASNVTDGLGFLLYIVDGKLKILEGYTYDEPWPNEIKNLILTYSKGKNRDIIKIKEIIERAYLRTKSDSHR